MAELLKLREADDPRDVIHRAVHCLVEGKLVSLPTEAGTVVAAASLQAGAVGRLADLAEARSSESNPVLKKLMLCVKSEAEARDYATEPNDFARRLMNRLWPGPVVLSLPVRLDQGLHKRFPEASRRAVLKNPLSNKAEIWFRVSNHEVVQSVLALLPAPLIVWQDRARSDKPSPEDGGNDAVDLIIEDAPHHNRGFPTIVEINHDSWTILESGIVTEAELIRMTGHMILFVCTGNTCRSPLAEGLFRKLLAERLDCPPEELAEKGYTIASAGLAAVNGAPAAQESVDVAESYGADLRSHSSQPLTDDLLEKADRVFTMTQSHRDSILFARPEAAERVSLLSVEGRDISDPIGGGPSEYESCGREILRHLEARLDQLDVSPSR